MIGGWCLANRSILHNSSFGLPFFHNFLELTVFVYFILYAHFINNNVYIRVSCFELYIRKYIVWLNIYNIFLTAKKLWKSIHMFNFTIYTVQGTLVLSKNGMFYQRDVLPNWISVIILQYSKLTWWAANSSISMERLKRATGDHASKWSVLTV